MSDVQRFWVQRGALYPDDAEREHHRRTQKLRVVEADAYDALARQVEELQKHNAEMKQELAGLYRFKRGIDEALNSGDGVYRP